MLDTLRKRFSSSIVSVGKVIVPLSWCYVGWNYGIQVYILEGPSMSPTFNSSEGDKDWVLAEHLTRLTNNWKRRDIVVLMDPTDATRFMCKRIVAMENEEIPQSWKKLREEHVPQAWNNPRELVKYGPVWMQVPKGHVWIEGDNPKNCLDSRHFGPVPLAMLKSRVIYRVFPSARIGSIR